MRYHVLLSVEGLVAVSVEAASKEEAREIAARHVRGKEITVYVDEIIGDDTHVDKED